MKQKLKKANKFLEENMEKIEFLEIGEQQHLFDKFMLLNTIKIKRNN